MTDALWQWDDLVRAAGATADGRPGRALTGFSIDTRTLAAGEVFVALKDQRDGHDFVAQAFAAGATAALVAKDYARQPGDGPLLRVEDTLQALEGIGHAARARLSPEARVIAVTGSAGKTGTKEMLRACLSRCGATHAPEKSFNNHWGVPLTLARMPAATHYGVFEIGMNHAGEIAPLTRMVRPHVAIITTVEPVHLEHFPSVEAIADAKAEIFLGLQPSGTAVINRDNPHFERLAAHARAANAHIFSFGRHPQADVRPLVWDIGRWGSRVEIEADGRRVGYELAAAGEHLAMNSLGVAAALLAAGADRVIALPALRTFEAPKGRGSREQLYIGNGTALLIDESYNANPASMRAALDAMDTLPREDGLRIVVLGDMLELGPQAEMLHRGLKNAIEQAGVDLVFACGPRMKLLYDDLPATYHGGWEPSADKLVTRVLDEIQAGDTVMVKGSNGSRTWLIVEALRQKFGTGAG